jgi:hypothetical protein
MKKLWLVSVLALVLTAGLVAGCGGQVEDEAAAIDPTLLHGGYSKVWSLVEFYENDESIPVPEWAADNIIVINNDGTGMHIFGEVDKDASDAIAQDDFTWSLEEDKLITQGNDSYTASGTVEFTIIELTEETHVLERTTEVDGIAVTTRSVYQSVVTPNPDVDEANLALTRGLAKIWRMESVMHDGATIAYTPHRQDDLLILCTDGTGYFTKGELLEAGNEGINNDLFTWQFSEDGSQLLLDELEHGHMIHLSSTIKQLDSENLIYEDYREINGKKTLVTVHRVPLLAAE